MSVYTTITLPDLPPLLDQYELGAATRLDGIAEGVVNTNYRLETEQGRYILTLIENPDHARELPYILSLMAHLSRRGIPAPLPVAGQDGQLSRCFMERDALIVTLLPGKSPDHPTPEQCHQAGMWLARIHREGAAFPRWRANPVGVPAWNRILRRVAVPLAKEDPKVLKLLRQTLEQLQKGFLVHPHPSGACHADLFPDNALFEGDRLTGVIDFHYACSERWVYDLAVTLDAWCHDPDGELMDEAWSALLEGYQEIRPLEEGERNALPEALRASSLRFALTRLEATLFPRAGENVTRKPPAPFLRRLARRGVLPPVPEKTIHKQSLFS